MAINMYDLSQHFVVPWTRGTGCSVALLMDANPKPAELVLSHVWGGSVLETYGMLQRVSGPDGRLPRETRIFFCAFSLSLRSATRFS